MTKYDKNHHEKNKSQKIEQKNEKHQEVLIDNNSKASNLLNSHHNHTEKSKVKEKISDKTYYKELEKLQVELVAMQEWVQATGKKICILFEGRDGAGKGGVIKAINERVSSRVFKTVALPAPTEREKSQMYMQRYIPHLPAAGEIVIFDRSWYNRAGVERVMGFCTEEESKSFLQQIPLLEQSIIHSGIILLKYWLEVSMGEQERRIRGRMTDPKKIWKLSPMDVKSYSHWYDYSRARDEMILASDTAWAPWFIADSCNKQRARLNIISHILSQIPYEKIEHKAVKLPKREEDSTYHSPTYPIRTVPEIF